MEITHFSSVFGNYDFEFEDVDFLLKRDWCMSIEDLDDLLWSIRQDVFDCVVKNRRTYSRWIYEHIESYNPNPRPYIQKIQLKVKDYTDEMIKKDEEDKVRKELEEYEKYQPPSRPLDYFDQRYDTLIKNIELNRNPIETEMHKKELEKVKHFVNMSNFYWKQEQWRNAKNVNAKLTSS